MIRRKQHCFYLLSIICFISLCIFMVSLRVNRKHAKEDLPPDYRDELIPKRPFKVRRPSVMKGYLVHNKVCRIKQQEQNDVSDLSIIHNDSVTYLIDEPEVLMLSYVQDNRLYLNMTAMQLFAKRIDVNVRKISCCYRTVYTGLGNRANSDIRFDKNCYHFDKSVVPQNEIFQVECFYQDVIYQHTHAIIKIKPNVEKRCRRSKHKFQRDSDHLSVMIVGIDGTSRDNFHRFMGKTKDILVRNSAIEFVGMSSLGENTYPNLIPLLTGLSSKEFGHAYCRVNHSQTLDFCLFLWNSFANNGFRTAYIEDLHEFNLFTSRGGFVRPPTDYYFYNMFLANANENFRKHGKKAWKLIETEQALNLTYDFAQKFFKNTYFSFTWLNALTHGNILGAVAMDDALSRFLSDLVDRGFLNNTLVVVMSDHGVRYGDFRQSHKGWYEARLPLFYMMFPKWFLSKYKHMKKNLFASSVSLVTHYDLHETIKDVLFHEHYRQHPGKYIDEYEDVVLATNSPTYHKLYKNTRVKGISLFKKIPKNRNCEKAAIPPLFCPCHAMHQVSFQSEFVPIAIERLIAELNKITAKAPSCANLTMKVLLDVRALIPNDSSDQYNVLNDGNALTERRYLILFKTAPGNAVFEGTFDVSPSDLEPKNISLQRVSAIVAHDTKCIKKKLLKMYCYCNKPKNAKFSKN